MILSSRARSCSRNCARFGATIDRAVRTSCASLTRRPDPPIARVSSSRNSPDSSLPVAAQRALDRAGREGVLAERRLPHRGASLLHAPVVHCRRVLSVRAERALAPRQHASRRAATVRRGRGLVWVVVWWLSPSQPSRRPTACRVNRSPLVLARPSFRSARWSQPPPPPRAGAASEATRATGGLSRAHGRSTRGVCGDSARGLPARSQGPVARVRAA